ncbi:MAG: ABC transporter permease [Terriglobia bacterium]
MSALFQDLKFGLRMLAKSPRFTLLAVLTLALGIGANSTIFSWISGTLLDPIPGATRTSHLVELTRGTAGHPDPISYPDFLDIRRQNRSFTDMITYSIWPADMTGAAKPQRVWVMMVSANYFKFLGVSPVLGRGFLHDEDKAAGTAPVAVISYRLWQRDFGGERSSIGRTVDINHHPYTVVGVAPSAFQGTESGLQSDLWVPVTMATQIDPADGLQLLRDRGAEWVLVMGRLKPGVTRSQAQAGVGVLYQEIAKLYPDSHKGDIALALSPLWRAPFGANYYLHTILFLLMAIAGIVLLLACANEANLLLVRSVMRRREMAIRLSLGATRWRLFRQLLVESLLLALCGGGVAMLVTLWTAATLPGFIPPADVPISMTIHAGSTVLLATLAIAILTATIFGVLPALRASNVQPATVLKEESGTASGGRSKARLSSSLVVVQIALSFLLLICAGLFIRSFNRALRFDPGFNSHHVLLMSFDLNGVDYNDEQGIQFDRQVLAKARALSGVQSATLADWVPLGFFAQGNKVRPEGYSPQPHESMDVRDASLGPGYFETMQIPLISGRDFTDQDTHQSPPVMIVNQKFVDHFWPHQDAVGKRVFTRGKWRSVVGVVRNSDYVDLREHPRAFFFLPLFQDYVPGGTIYVRVRDNPLASAAAVEKIIRGYNPDVPVFNITTLGSRVLLNSTNHRIAATFAGAFGALALILAAVGIYGVLAYTTRQRTREIGIRMAFGATSRDVFNLVLRQGSTMALVGLGIGLAASLVATRALSSQLFGITASDPLTFAGVFCLLAGASLLACYIPARRATKVDPMVALRQE